MAESKRREKEGKRGRGRRNREYEIGQRLNKIKTTQGR